MSEELHCSFCGKSQFAVRQLIRGTKALICDECVDLCVAILGECHDREFQQRVPASVYQGAAA